MTGKYSSELERDKTLAKEKTTVTSEELGTIFAWVPRLCYTDSEVKYLKENSILEYEYTSLDCFKMPASSANNIDLSFTGFWVGQDEFSNKGAVEAKNNEMNNQDNAQGLMANEKVLSLTESDKTAIQKLYEKVGSVAQNMSNRQTIKIVNTNNKEVILATHKVVDDKIEISDAGSKYGIAYITDKDGNKISKVGSKFQASLDEETTSYLFYLVDNKGNIKKYRVSYGSGKPNLKGFNLSNTFYVMYDENGNETSEIPAGETAPEDWYNYENQRWANIVVRDNGNEIYYTWIPRYMYTLNETEQTVNAKLVDLGNIWTDPEDPTKQEDLNNKLDEKGQKYVLPEAFTWEDPKNPNEKVQLAGFWASKYKLREGGTAVSNISGGYGTITVSNLTEATEKVSGTENNKYICEIYLIKDGKRIKWSEQESKYIVDTTATYLNSTSYTYENLETGNYTVNIIIKNNDERQLQVKAITKQVKVIDGSSVNKPNLDGFDKDHTFYVTYTADGKEDSYIPITEPVPENWYNYYDQRWANIVVRLNENEIYYTWIPRYGYALNSVEEKTNVEFISGTGDAPAGYTLPEAFTWEDPNNPDEKVQLDGFWTSKYKLREGAGTPSNNIFGTGNAIKVTSALVPNGYDTSYDYYLHAYSKEKKEDGVTSKYQYHKQITSLDNTLDKGEDGAKVVAGEYIVTFIKKDKNGNHVEGISRDVTVIDTQEAYKPDLEYYVTAQTDNGKPEIGSEHLLFNPDITYYAEYDATGKTIINTDQTLNMTRPTKWYNYDDVSNLDANPIVEATIVVRENDYDTYYKWIPRYQYSTSDDIAHRVYISTEKTEPDDGYTIPNKFKDAEGNPITDETGKPIKGYWQKFKTVSNGISANIITTENEIKITQIVLPKDSNNKATTGKIKLTSESVIVHEFEDLNGDSHTYSNLDPSKKYEISIFAYDTNGNIVNIFVLEERLYVPKLNIETQNFNKSNTFYVFYDEAGNESSEIPIGTALTEEQQRKVV